MDIRIVIKTLTICSLILITLLGADKIPSVENPTIQTIAAEVPKISRTEAQIVRKSSEDKEILKGFIHLEDEKTIENVPHIRQLPELERGCEVTSLSMLLHSAGVSADKMDLAKQIHTIPFIDAKGARGNPNDGFVGDIYTFKKSGYGVYHGPVAQLAERYLPGKIKDITGQPIEAIYEMIHSGSPVWVITNSRFAPLPESEFSKWKTNTGEVKITYKEHSVVVVGYNKQTIYINDPLATKGYIPVPRQAFEQAWIQMGSQAIGIKK